MAEGHHKLESVDQIGEWAKAHVADTFEWDLIWAKPQLPHWHGIGLSKYMCTALIAAALCVLILVPLARRVRAAHPWAPTGPLWNFFEVILVYLREKVARPAIGHDADRFVPAAGNEDQPESRDGSRADRVSHGIPPGKPAQGTMRVSRG